MSHADVVAVACISVAWIAAVAAMLWLDTKGRQRRPRSRWVGLRKDKP